MAYFRFSDDELREIPDAISVDRATIEERGHRADDGRLQVELSGPEAFGVTATMGKRPYSMDWIPPID